MIYKIYCKTMSQEILLDRILSELRTSRETPLAIYEEGLSVYIVHGLVTLPAGGSSGYPVLKITSPTTSHTFFESGFLLETSRRLGANGATPNTNLKSDVTNGLLLVTDISIIYG